MSKKHRKKRPEKTASRRVRQVFRNPSARGDWIVRIAVALLLLAGIVLVGIIAVRLLIAPTLPDLSIPTADQPSSAIRHATPAASDRSADPTAIETNLERPKAWPPTPAYNPWRVKPPSLYAFVPAWSTSARGSLETHLRAIDVLLPQWFEIVATSNGSVAVESAGRRTSLGDYVDANRAAEDLMPVSGFSGDPGAVATALSNTVARRQVVDALAAAAVDGGYRGLCLDFSSLPTNSHGDALLLASALAKALHDTGRETCVVIPLGGAVWPLEEVAATADRVILLAFAEPRSGSHAGPIAAQDWVADEVTAALGQLDPARTIVGLGTAAYEWVDDDPEPRRIDYPTATRLAARYNAEIRLDPASLNSTFAFTDASGRRHEVWFLDAVSAYDEGVALSPTGVGGVAVWPVGGEDPGVWSLFGAASTPPADAVARLKNVLLDNYVGYEGDGEFQKVVATPSAGIQLLETDPTSGLIAAEHYQKLPHGYEVERWDGGEPADIALTFDDGPDPVYTPRLLDTLKNLHVPAAFFVIGENALNHPSVVRRMVDEGHILGSHTYWHADLSTSSNLFTRMGLNAAQRAIAGLTGRNTVLFRAPYGEIEDPATAAAIRPLVLLGKLGYIAVGMAIDPADWRRPGADVIVNRVVDAARRREGHIIILHDAGGDRSETVEALPKIIETLRAEGFHFVSLDTLVGMTRDELMPIASGAGILLDTWLVRSVSFLRDAIVFLFTVALSLGVIRTVAMVVLVFLRKRHRPAAPGFAPPITVLVPAYCEETIIVEFDRLAARLELSEPQHPRG